MPRTEKALDLQRYITESGFNSVAFENDIARFARESDRGKALQDRITHHSYTRLGDNWIIDARLGDQPISSYFRYDTPLNIQESSAGLQIAQMLDDEPDGTLAIWISPIGGPGNYDEGRFDVSLKRNGKDYGVDISFTESYGIVSTFLPQEYVYLGWKAAANSPKHYTFETAEDLRGLVFILHPPDHVDPWDWMNEIFPDPDTWNPIKSGEVIIETRKAEEAARRARLKVQDRISNAKTEYDYIEAGAIAEQHMAEEGYQVSSGPCGDTNSDILKNALMHLQGATKIDQNGEITYWVNYCGRCCATVKDWIKEGYICKSCGGVYRR